MGWYRSTWQKHIRHEGGKWVLYDHTGTRVLGRHPTYSAALRQERAVQYFQHKSLGTDFARLAISHTASVPWSRTGQTKKPGLDEGWGMPEPGQAPEGTDDRRTSRDLGAMSPREREAFNLWQLLYTEGRDGGGQQPADRVYLQQRLKEVLRQKKSMERTVTTADETPPVLHYRAASVDSCFPLPFDREEEEKGKDWQAQQQKVLEWWGRKEWHESDHPRGQPENAGQFASGGGGAKNPATSTARRQKPKSADRPKWKAKSKPATRVPEKQPSAKAERAKAAHKLVNADIQRYAEEHNEPMLASAVGGAAFPDSEPVDVAIPADKKDLARWQKEAKRWRASKEAGEKRPAPMDLSGAAAHGIEMKTMVDNTNAKITMDSYSQVRKLEWEQEHDAIFHTVILDDQAVFNAKGEGKHDESKRRILYRRGVAGSARIGGLYECKDMDELKRLMKVPEDQLPEAARRTDGKLRVGKWKYFEDDEGKGYKNQKTGQIVRAKK